MKKNPIFSALAMLLLGLAACDTALEEPIDTSIRDGTDSGHLTGNVQFFVNGSYRCTGTLIASEWVLTAKHCLPNANTENSAVLLGDRKLGEGDGYGIAEFVSNPDVDVALLKLEDGGTPPGFRYARAYSDEVPEIDRNVSVRGWGGPGRPRPFLQVATLRVDKTDAVSFLIGNRMVLSDIGQGFIEKGDSGAGVWVNRSGGGGPSNGMIVGVISQFKTIENCDQCAGAVPTADIANWIENTTGVPPTLFGID